MRGKLFVGVASAVIVAAFTGVAHAQTEPAGDAGTEARISIGETVQGELAPAGDRDWYRLSVAADTAYRISLNSGVEIGLEGAIDPLLVIYDASGAELMRNDDANETLNSELTYNSARAGEVFIEARGFLDDAAGGYALSVSSAALVPDDAGDDASTRARLTPGQSMTGAIGHENDADWFRLSVREGNLYRISLNADDSAATPLGDPLLRVIGSDGEELAYNDDGPESLNSYLDFIPRSSGDVFAAAGGFGGATGAYVLSAEASRLPPDDAGADARTRASIAVGASVEGALGHPGDVDWRRVRLTGGESYRFTLSTPDVEGRFDPVLRLFDRAGDELAFNDDGGGQLNSYLEFTAPATGDYYLEAAGFTQDASGPYTLTALAGDIPADASTDAQLGADGDWRPGVLSPAGDRDWYRIELTEGQSLRIGLDAAQDATPLADPFLALYGPDGSELASDDDSGEGLNALLEYTAAAAGPHFVEARGYIAEEAEGNYTLTVMAGEIGADAETADYLAVGGEQRASRIGAAGDADWFGVDLIEGRPYRFNVASSEFDTVLRLFDANGVEVAMDDDGGTQTNSYLSFVTPTGGGYYAAVAAYDGASVGAYTVSVVDTDVPGGAVTDEFLDTSAGDDRTSALEFRGDHDAYAVSLEEGVTYLIEVVSEGETPLRDPKLRVLNSSGEEVLADDNSGPGQNALLRFTPEIGDLFFIEAYGAGDALGAYRISITPEG